MIKNLALAGMLALLVGCQFNVFDPVDAPTTDLQLKSAARGCLDRHDYACAADLYAKLAASSGNCATDGTNQPCADVANSELAFSILDQNGAGFGAVAAGFGTGGASLSALNPIVRSVYGGAGLAKRHLLYTAYQKVALINNTSLKNLTRFLTAVALAAEFAAEGAADSDGVLRKTSLENTPTTCNSTTDLQLNGPCGAPAGVKFSATTGGSIVTAEPTSTLTYDLFNSAINEAVTGLTGIGVSGGFTSTLGAFNTVLGAGTNNVGIFTTINGNLYREILVTNGLGE